MSFLGYERPVEYTGYQIFDPTMAKMILDAQDKYFNAVYADYQQGLEEMKEFKKEYYDFDTPILADQDWYNRNVTGKVRNFINDAYARGIDLTRSPEGRAAIAQMINSVDVGKVAKLRSSKQAAEDYIKARGVLQSKGLYSPEMEAFVTGGRSLENWNTLGGDGIWNRTSPIEAASLLDLTYNSYKNRTPRDLTAEDLKAAGIPYDARYQYTGYLDSDLMKVAPGAAMSIAADPRAAYYRHLAEQEVAARGDNYTQADVDAQFYRDIANANKWALVDPTKKADEFALDYYKTANDDWLDQRKSARDLNNALSVERFKAENGGRGYGGSSGSRSNSGTGGTNGGKTPVSYYEPMYENLVTNTINNDPHRTYMFNNKEFSLDMGNSLYQSQQNIAEDYFGDGTVKSIYGNNTSTKSTSFGFNPKIKWDNGSAVLDMNPTTGLSRSTSVDINKTMRQDLTNSDAFRRKFNNNYNDYLDRMSLDFESGMFANSWNHGESKVSEVTQDGKTIERLRGKNYVYMAPEDVDKVYSGKELAARASGATGKILEDAIAETKRIRNALKSGNIIMRGSGKMLGVGLYDTGQYGAYAKIHIANYDGADGLSSEQDAYIMTPYQSTPNPNFSKDGTFNLGFDQSYDLSRKNMDNAAIRKLGVSSNTGTIDNTLPDSNPWYTMDGLDSFDWPDDDDIE